mmetsp:Transcript_17914/g.39744  ORF Transcript_17914/g.39744 Transcript_17914/m.39744 type:complete len:243 (+) Transcript_17914:139-867(+)
MMMVARNAGAASAASATNDAKQNRAADARLVWDDPFADSFTSTAVDADADTDADANTDADASLVDPFGCFGDDDSDDHASAGRDGRYDEQEGEAAAAAAAAPPASAPPISAPSSGGGGSKPASSYHGAALLAPSYPPTSSRAGMATSSANSVQISSSMPSSAKLSRPRATASSPRQSPILDVSSPEFTESRSSSAMASVTATAPLAGLALARAAMTLAAPTMPLSVLIWLRATPTRLVPPPR